MKTQSPTILGGIFKGMKYVDASCGSSYHPKIIGTYELEIAPILIQEIARHNRFINIGCGEGYYAVGAAMLNPAMRVVAFDSDPEAVKACRQMAELNGVSDRVKVVGACDAPYLDAVLRPGELILCDTEGGERDILDPAKILAINACDIIVELHDVFYPGLSEMVLSRFASTHTIAIIPQTVRNIGESPLIANLSAEAQAAAMDEQRPWRMSFSWLCRRAAL